jgi:NAD(P)-dependent dehydrogenase (short-subunit alcohol dehydrogenase family)
VSKKATAVALVDTAVEAFGAVDILVNNAGVTHAAEFLDLDEADFDRVLAINLKSMFLCGQAAARRMVAQGKGGAVVNLSSVNAVLAIPNQVPYCVSKGGIAQLTKVMALSLASHGIRVNAIGPGTIATEMAKKAVLGSEEAKRKILSRTPMGRLGEPEEIASIAAFLASDDASYVTGQTIYPDGGRLGLNYNGAGGLSPRTRGSPPRRGARATGAIPASRGSTPRPGSSQGCPPGRRACRSAENFPERDRRRHLARQVGIVELVGVPDELAGLSSRYLPPNECELPELKLVNDIA